MVGVSLIYCLKVWVKEFCLENFVRKVIFVRVCVLLVSNFFVRLCLVFFVSVWKVRLCLDSFWCKEWVFMFRLWVIFVILGMFFVRDLVIVLCVCVWIVWFLLI